MVRVVPSIPVEVRQIDATDERHPVVDDNGLLVVAVQGPLPRVQGALDPSAGAEPIANPTDVTPPRPLHREGSARPDQDADGDP